MALKPTKISLLLLATLANALPQTPTTPSNTPTDTPTPTIIGLPAITSITNSDCNNEGYAPTSSTTPYHSLGFTYDVLSCVYGCQITTYCISYSWNTSSAAFASGTNCGFWNGFLDGIGFIPSPGTGAFFSNKYAAGGVYPGCYGVEKVNSTSSTPFPPEEGVWVNTGVDDCSIQGTATADYGQGEEGSYTYGSVLTCQEECNTVDGCTSYSWTPGTGSCQFSYSWVAGEIVPGETGTWFSDAQAKTGNACYSNSTGFVA